MADSSALTTDDPLFVAADREWAALVAKAEKDKARAKAKGKTKPEPNPIEQMAKLFGAKKVKKKEPEIPDPLTPHERAIQTALAPLKRVAAELEAKWGFDRLPSLVDGELAARFASARLRLDEAISAQDMEQIKQRAEVMRRGWQKLDEAATAAGHDTWGQPDVWEGRRPDGRTFLIARDRSTAIAANRSTGTGVWTVEEIGRLLQHVDGDGFTQSMKEEFAGELVGISAPQPAKAATKKREIVEI